MLRDRITKDEFFDRPKYHLNWGLNDNADYRLIPNKKFIILVGVWPYLSPRKRKSIGFAVNIFVGTAWVPELIHIIEIIDETKEFIYCLLEFICLFLALCGSINAAMQPRSNKRLVDSLRDICYYLVGVIYIVSPLIPSASHYRVTGDWIAPIRNVLEVEFFIDPVNYYWKLYVLLVHMCMGVVSLHLANDSFFVMVVLHCCGMFAVLRYKVEQMNKEMIVHGYSCNQQLAVKRIKEIVMYHLEFANKIEDFFCIQFIVQILVNTIIISVCGSQIIQLADQSLRDSLLFAFLTSATIFCLTFFNVCGQGVYDHSLRVHDRLIHTTWYECPIKARKLFIILYNRSAEPYNLTAAKMINLNFVTCTQVSETRLFVYTV
ncbi:hypothetical protein TKK_0004149 [Trichogramma kaykai]